VLVELRRNTGLEQATGGVEGLGQHVGPHVAMDVMHPHDSASRCPHRPKPRHPVPDLDGRDILRSATHDASGELSTDHSSEDVISPTSLHHDVPVPIEGTGVASRGAVHDVDAHFGPPTEDLVGMKF
jgi:hypothetical protein